MVLMRITSIKDVMFSCICSVCLLFTVTPKLMNRSLGNFIRIGLTKEEVNTFWERSGLYSGHKTS